VKRIVSQDTVLGLHDECFKLTKGDEIEAFETNKYGRVRVIIQEKETTVSKPMLERISNKEFTNSE